MDIVNVILILCGIAVATYTLFKIKAINRQKDNEIAELHEQLGSLREKNQQDTALHLENNQEIEELTQKLEEQTEKSKKILSQKKSSETRLGQTAEQIAPFLAGCPHKPGDMHFMGKPIDFLVIDFDQGEVVFLEVKSGGAKESSRQRAIKNMIKSGHVYYEIMRINEDGVKHKREKNNF